MNHILCLILIAMLSLTVKPVKGQVHKAEKKNTKKNIDTLISGSEYEEFMCAAGDTAFQDVNFIWTDAPSFQQHQEPKKVPLFKLTGTVQYDFTYRSLVDTPYSQKNFAQHSLQASFGILVRNSYPLHLTMLARRSNSPYFTGIGDINLQFDRRAFIAKIREELMSRIGPTSAQSRVISAQQELEQKSKQIVELREWLNHPARKEEIIGERLKIERQSGPGDSLISLLPDYLRAKVPGSDTSLNIGKMSGFSMPDIDSLATQSRSITQKVLDSIRNKNSRSDEFNAKKLKLDSMEMVLQDSQDKFRKLKTSITDSLASAREEIAGLKDPESVREYVRQKDVKDLPQGWNTLLNIQKVGLGRNWVNYSELTVKNISLTGVNIEMNPSRLYFAFAAGRVNYRFRDFIINNPDRQKQNLWLARAGLGSRETNNIIFTYYEGKRNLLSNAVSSLQSINGFSVESKLSIDPRNAVILEVAKSSSPGNAVRTSTTAAGNKMLDFKERNNEAYSVNLTGYLPWTRTNITGHYKRMGNQFQSFNLHPLNVNQESYHVKFRQVLWKKRLSLEAGLRKNDFANPLTTVPTSSKILFKSFQATLRGNKYPTVTIGYYPSSQLTIVDKDVLIESQYNTLNAIVSHSYQWRKLLMNTSILNTRFFNGSTDTNFIYYNANTTAINHNINWKSFQFTSGCTVSRQTGLNVFTLEQSAGVQIKQWLFLSAGGKYNRLNHQQTMWGENGTLAFSLQKLGVIQLMYDRSYLPGSSRNLLPLQTGTATYKKTF